MWPVGFINLNPVITLLKNFNEFPSDFWIKPQNLYHGVLDRSLKDGKQTNWALRVPRMTAHWIKGWGNPADLGGHPVWVNRARSLGRPSCLWFREKREQHREKTREPKKGASRASGRVLYSSGHVRDNYLRSGKQTLERSRSFPKGHPGIVHMPTGKSGQPENSRGMSGELTRALLHRQEKTAPRLKAALAPTNRTYKVASKG